MVKLRLYLPSMTLMGIVFWTRMNKSECKRISITKRYLAITSKKEWIELTG